MPFILTSSMRTPESLHAQRERLIKRRARVAKGKGATSPLDREIRALTHLLMRMGA